MNEIVFGGIIAAVLFTELTDLSPGGLIVPAYLALYIYDPERIAATVLLAFFCMGIVRLCSRWMILYGRRRYFVFIATKKKKKMALGMSGVGMIGTIGYLVPGLLGRDMERQGVLKTLAAAVIVTVFIVLAGMALGVAWL